MKKKTLIKTKKKKTIGKKLKQIVKSSAKISHVNSKRSRSYSSTNSKDSLRESFYHKKYEFIDITTADVAFVAYGRTLSELFENAALAMFEVMIDIKKVKQIQKRSVEVTGHDLPALMFNWLNELLVYVDAENLAFSDFKVSIDENAISKSSGEDSHNTNSKHSEEIVKSSSRISNNILKLKAVCKGEKIDQKKHELGTVVKSCTYHKMEIKQISKPSKDGSYDKIWQAQIILDI